MPTFKDYLQSDLSTFFNGDELAATHTINDSELVIVQDDEKLSEAIKFEGLSADSIVYHVPASAYGKLPKINEFQSFDGKPMLVVGAINNEGVYQITLTGYSSGNG